MWWRKIEVSCRVKNSSTKIWNKIQGWTKKKKRKKYRCFCSRDMVHLSLYSTRLHNGMLITIILCCLQNKDDSNWWINKSQKLNFQNLVPPLPISQATVLSLFITVNQWFGNIFFQVRVICKWLKKSNNIDLFWVPVFMTTWCPEVQHSLSFYLCCGLYKLLLREELCLFNC